VFRGSSSTGSVLRFKPLNRFDARNISSAEEGIFRNLAMRRVARLSMVLSRPERAEGIF
jgi:hypothetical protein